MTIITITISLEVDNNTIKLTQHKEVNLKDIINLLTLEEQNSSYQDITLGELIDKYAIDKNLKQSSIRNYKSGLSSLFGVNYRNLQLKEICSSSTIKNCNSKVISQKSYRTLKAILNYAIQKKILLNNPYDYNLLNVKQKKPTHHREALNSENWLSLKEIENNLSIFINSLKSSELNFFTNYPKALIYYIAILTMILSTRINETFQVIKNFNSTAEKNHYIFIDNKNTKKDAKLTFRLVLTNGAIDIIKTIHSLNVKSYSSTYLQDLTRKLFDVISKQIDNKITLHGLRTIYRTTIEFLPETQNISHWIKEYSLSHETRNKVERSYLRNDAFKMRYILQLEYSKFIFKIIKNSKLIEIANNDLWWKEL